LPKISPPEIDCPAYGPLSPLVNLPLYPVIIIRVLCPSVLSARAPEYQKLKMMR